MNLAIFDQLSKSSNKVLFQYNLLTGKFDYLSLTVESLWEIDKALIEQSPPLLAKRIDENDQEAVALRLEKVWQGQACQIEFSLCFSSDRSKQVKVDAHPVLDDSGRLTSIVGLVEDVTQQAQYREFLLEFSRKKNNALQIVAHDLQGPLAIMKGVAVLMEMDHTQQNYQDLASHLSIIYRAYEDCNKLIADVLRDEHIKSVATPVNTVRFDIVERVKQTVEAFVQSKVIQMTMEVSSSEEKIMVELDEVKFTQILNNLITNSIKFTPPEGRIRISLELQQNRLFISHADTGIGIPREIQPYLFEKHNSKAARPGLNGEKPNAIGLSIVKDLVELQGGTIQLESEESKGTTFYLSFPLLL
ncbi:hypothetical protein AHMF7605_21700 [Adhaeribacter arboris]|uniref:histidine kinase n=1 Tax=Adhaeribacter arboris TaxID=2072846 RepID=A0A2T2YKB3_9BACT|nr:HAMP domain-containing sensor histidine kinase [Adhaeribacter arboris]PSR55929.1 hypothetical protein AHMF7605_21700 [Adhaeribacter arboris]